MAKKMTVFISDDRFNWMMDFIQSEEPNFDAPELFANLIMSASFEDVKDVKDGANHD